MRRFQRPRGWIRQPRASLPCANQSLAAHRAEGLGAVRAALKRTYARITLTRVDGELVLLPEVRSFVEIEAWALLEDGRMAVKPKPQSLALPAKKLAREPSFTNPWFAVFGAIPLGDASA